MEVIQIEILSGDQLDLAGCPERLIAHWGTACAIRQRELSGNLVISFGHND
jgi:hypothetical protein